MNISHAFLGLVCIELECSLVDSHTLADRRISKPHSTGRQVLNLLLLFTMSVYVDNALHGL
jgi:hypothetical protein